MTTSSTRQTHRQILWVQVGGLALVQGAIALMWVIYNLYLVELLALVGFSRGLATALLIVENLLAMVMEPLMGSLSDRLQQQLGTRFPLVSLGVILSAGIFIGLPALALGGLGQAMRWLLPLMLVAWALAMTVFRSPAMSLLGRYAFGTQLPQAASILTLVGGVAGAMGPLASSKLLSWGPIVVFSLGSGVLILATLVLRWAAAQPRAATLETEASAEPTPDSALVWSALPPIFGAGVGVALGFRSLMMLFSRVLDSRVVDGSPALVLGTVFVALAVTAIPAGALAVRLGNRRAMILGLAGLAFVCVAIGVVSSNGTAIALAILFGAAFSLVSNGTIPFALSMVPAPKAGLGTGMFFSGGAAASSLFGTVVASLQSMPLGISTAVGVTALLLAGGCIAAAPRRAASVVP